MAAKFASDAADDLTCPICCNFYIKPFIPKNLPKCSHMCCSLCLKQITEGGLKTFKCPLCNEVSKLPKDGVDGLITSLIVRNLAEKHPEGVKQRREHMQQELEQQTHVTAEKLKETEKTEQKIQASIEQEVRELEKEIETMMTQAQDMIKQIRDLGQQKLTEVRKEKVRLEQQMKDIEQTQRKLRTVSDSEFQTETDTLVNQIEKLKIRIVKPRTLKLVDEFGRFKGATGIASKPYGTLAVSDSESNSPQVHVYRYDNDRYKNAFQFNIKQTPLVDIAVSSDDKYLVTRPTGFEIYSSDGEYQKTVNVTTDPKQKVTTFSIATAKDGRILLGSEIEGEEEEPDYSVITVHDKAGKTIKTIRTTIQPIRIADICGMNVVATSVCQHKVCVYNLESGKETLNVDIPAALCVCHDEESACLLIGRDTKAVYGSCVIEQYCCVTGTFVAILAKGLKDPTAMTITQDGMLLAVADEKTVKMYKMK